MMVHLRLFLRLLEPLQSAIGFPRFDPEGCKVYLARDGLKVELHSFVRHPAGCLLAHDMNGQDTSHGPPVLNNTAKDQFK